MKETETQKAIEAEAELRYPVKNHSNPPDSPYVHSQKTFIHGCNFGYELGRSKADEEKEKEIEFLNQNCDNLNEVINDCGKEIGRLKELMEVAFRYGFTNNFKKSTVDFQWQQFKTENNL